MLVKETRGCYNSTYSLQRHNTFGGRSPFSCFLFHTAFEWQVFIWHKYIEVNQQNSCYIIMGRLIKVYAYSSHKSHQEKNDWMTFMLNAIAYDRSSQPSLVPNFRTPIVFTEDSWVNNGSRMTECWAKLHEPRIFYPSGHWPETVTNARVSARFR